MSTLPAVGQFLPNAQSNADAGADLEAVMAYLREALGGNYQNATIAGGAITATTSNIYVDTEGAASTDDLDRINSVGRPVGAIIIVHSKDGARDVRVRGAQGGTGQIWLNTPSGHANTFTLADPTMALVLQKDGSDNWAEVVRFFGNQNGAWRSHLGLTDAATMPVASTGEMQAGDADNRVVTPVKMTTFANTYELVIGDRAAETDRWLNSYLLVGRSAADAGGVSWLRRISLENLLGAAFRSYHESGEIALTANTSGTVNMGFGSIPRLFEGFLRNKIAERGYNPGDEIRLDNAHFGETSRIITLAGYNSGVSWAMGSASAQVVMIDFNTRAQFLCTNANWRLFIRGWR